MQVPWSHRHRGRYEWTIPLSSRFMSECTYTPRALLFVDEMNLSLKHGIMYKPMSNSENRQSDTIQRMFIRNVTQKSKNKWSLCGCFCQLLSDYNAMWAIGPRARTIQIQFRVKHFRTTFSSHDFRKGAKCSKLKREAWARPNPIEICRTWTLFTTVSFGLQAWLLALLRTLLQWAHFSAWCLYVQRKLTFYLELRLYFAE